MNTLSMVTCGLATQIRVLRVVALRESMGLC